MKYLIFIFKRRFRRSALNNFLLVKQIKNINVINLSGPFLYHVGKILYFFLKSKKIIFISCDGLDYLYRETNSINLWMGGTTYKIPEKYKKFKNNFVSASSLFTDETKLLTFFPVNIRSTKINENYKFVYISENKKITNIKSLKIWEKYKDKILDNLNLIDNKNFWNDIVDKKNDPAQKIYIDIKSLIRSKLVDELYKILKSKFLLIGSNWKSVYPNALPSNS